MLRCESCGTLAVAGAPVWPMRRCVAGGRRRAGAFVGSDSLPGNLGAAQWSVPSCSWLGTTPGPAVAGHRVPTRTQIGIYLAVPSGWVYRRPVKSAVGAAGSIRGGGTRPHATCARARARARACFRSSPIDDRRGTDWWGRCRSARAQYLGCSCARWLCLHGPLSRIGPVCGWGLAARWLPNSGGGGAGHFGVAPSDLRWERSRSARPDHERRFW